MNLIKSNLDIKYTFLIYLAPNEIWRIFFCCSFPITLIIAELTPDARMLSQLHILTIEISHNILQRVKLSYILFILLFGTNYNI